MRLPTTGLPFPAARGRHLAGAGLDVTCPCAAVAVAFHAAAFGEPPAGPVIAVFPGGEAGPSRDCLPFGVLLAGPAGRRARMKMILHACPVADAHPFMDGCKPILGNHG